MTVLTKPIKRELPIKFDRRAWNIELTHWGINFRAKRTRRSLPIEWESILVQAHKIVEAADRAEKARIRKEKRGSK